jgi:cell division protein FtsB
MSDYLDATQADQTIAALRDKLRVSNRERERLLAEVARLRGELSCAKDLLRRYQTWIQ